MCLNHHALNDKIFRIVSNIPATKFHVFMYVYNYTHFVLRSKENTSVNIIPCVQQLLQGCWNPSVDIVVMVPTIKSM